MKKYGKFAALIVVVIGTLVWLATAEMKDNQTYYKHLDAVLDTRPNQTMDDGCDLVSRLHQQRPHQICSRHHQCRAIDHTIVHDERRDARGTKIGNARFVSSRRRLP